MCGVCGIVSARQAVSAAEVTAMRDTMVHRGPDDAGLYLEPGVGLGHRRLSIIDLSPGGHQPMANGDGSLVVVFNGEIYNYRELRHELAGRGHTFASQSDTEVILHAYEEWGLEALSRFVGMFAFGLLDRPRRQLLLARDHVGIKPLYYWQGAGELLFASEVRALLARRHDLRRPDYAAVFDFLTLSRFDHDETTFFAGVRQVRAGHYMTVSLDRAEAGEQVPYWRPEPEACAARYDYGDAVGQFTRLLEESVGLQLRSDVPVGVFLSGGLDSSGLVALAAGRYPGRLRTFSVAYPGTEHDESAYIEAVLAQQPVEHRRTTPPPGKFAADLRRFVRAQEIPTNGPGPFSEWCVAELARGEVTVLLSGQGPDEMLGGYHRYFEPYLRSRWLDRGEGGRLAHWRAVGREARAIAGFTGRPLALLLGAALVPSTDWFRRQAHRRLRQRLLTSELRRHGAGVTVESPMSWPGRTPLDRALSESLTGWGIARLLHYADRNTMAFSLEARVPYLDHRLVEFCLGLPYGMKIRGTSTKWILREALRHRVPDCVVERRDKKGFPTPVSAWLRESRTVVEELLSPAAVRRRGLLREVAVRRLVTAHMSGTRDCGWLLWQLVNLEVWFQEFVD
ncbi:MAG: asparagine synthase (glutamine-hydrolyzing) [Gemmatimonadota bacterium]